MPETYGQMIARLRHDKGWTQRQLANESGVRLRTLQDVEGDKHTRPQRATRQALDATLGVEEGSRGEFPEDIEAILEIVGSYLETMTPKARLAWLRDLTVEAFSQHVTVDEANKARRLAGEALHQQRGAGDTPQRKVKDETG